MIPQKCNIRYGTSIMPFFAKLIDVVSPSEADFANSRLSPVSEDFRRLLEAADLQNLRRPSVSAILSAISDQKALYIWQKAQIEEMGLGAFKASMFDRMSLGTKTHTKVEEMLKFRADATENEEIERDLIKIIESEKNTAIRNFMKSALPVILEIQNPESAICEKRIRHPTLAYQGRFDAVVRYKGNWSILDWKTAPARSSFSKQGEDSLSYSSYVRQLAAYASAYNHDVRFEALPIVKTGLLVSLKEDGSPAEVYQISEQEMEKTFDDVKKKLQDFWSKVSAAKGPNLDLAYKP